MQISRIRRPVGGYSLKLLFIFKLLNQLEPAYFLVFSASRHPRYEIKLGLFQRYPSFRTYVPYWHNHPVYFALICIFTLILTNITIAENKWLKIENTALQGYFNLTHSRRQKMICPFFFSVSSIVLRFIDTEKKINCNTTQLQNLNITRLEHNT